jgi:hypothetical protein
MIIYNLNLFCVPVSPLETDPPLLVDANAVLTDPIPSQSFQPVPGWHPQSVQPARRIQHPQLPQGQLLQLSRQFPREFFTPNLRRFFARKTPDHLSSLNLPGTTIYGKRKYSQTASRTR